MRSLFTDLLTSMQMMFVALGALNEDVVTPVAPFHGQRRSRVLRRLHDRLRLLQLAVMGHPMLEKRHGRFEPKKLGD